ncbi:hypothetical protein H5410_047343 [Solanum commersonii]|uniref:Uncharacterized protein n=1 Tax=Solanum commersonii TaxID=4109 RepID=A0A9J5XGU2_SOLCO|nr:hypothetical protein H5410_047343 [Solanum commersonii]
MGFVVNPKFFLNLNLNEKMVGKQHPKEEEYLAFTRYVYNLPEESGETFGVLGTTSLFPRISIFPNGSPGFTAQLFEFGYLDRVYAKQDLKEISQLPTKLFNSVKNYAQGDGVYCRFYSISMECKDLQAYYPTLNYISVEKIKDFNVKATCVDKKLPHLNKKWIQTRRALGIKALYFILKRFYNEDCRVLDQDQDWILIIKGKSKSKELKDRILDIKVFMNKGETGGPKEKLKKRGLLESANAKTTRLASNLPAENPPTFLRRFPSPMTEEGREPNVSPCQRRRRKRSTTSVRLDGGKKNRKGKKHQNSNKKMLLNPTPSEALTSHPHSTTETSDEELGEEAIDVTVRDEWIARVEMARQAVEILGWRMNVDDNKVAWYLLLVGGGRYPVEISRGV